MQSSHWKKTGDCSFCREIKQSDGPVGIGMLQLERLQMQAAESGEPHLPGVVVPIIDVPAPPRRAGWAELPEPFLKHVPEADPFLLDQHRQPGERPVVRVQHHHGQAGELGGSVPAAVGRLGQHAAIGMATEAL